MQQDDIPRGYGSLAGDGVEHHDQVKTAVVNDGVSHRIACDRCGRGVELTIEWPEIIYMSQGQPPPNGQWEHNRQHGVFMPIVPCPACGDRVRIGITPDECNKLLKSGVHAGKITAPQIAGYVQRISR